LVHITILTILLKKTLKKTSPRQGLHGFDIYKGITS